MSGVPEISAAVLPQTRKDTVATLEEGVCTGNMRAKRRNERGINEAETNDVRDKIIPHGVAAYATTRPMLTEHPATASENAAKHWFTRCEGFFSQTPRPRIKVAVVVRSRTTKRSCTYSPGMSQYEDGVGSSHRVRIYQDVLEPSSSRVLWDVIQVALRIWIFEIYRGWDNGVL